jgi:lysophospholipase L1-like esterase
MAPGHRVWGRTVVGLTLLVGVSSIADTAEGRRVARLRRMVVVGDSLLAGFGSGGFVERGRPGQVDSAPAVIARRARVRLPQPLIDRPGVPPQLAIVDANRNGRLDRGEVRRRQASLGFRDDPDRPSRNLAVPGEDLTTVFEEVSPQDLAERLVRGEAVDGIQALKLLVLGFPLREEPVSQLVLARELEPTFLLVWIGNNETLGMATGTDPGGADLTVAGFGIRYRQLLHQLATTGADMAVANLPDPTGAPVLRRAAGEVTQCRGPGGGLEPVAADDLLSIDLDPSSLPSPPCDDVLSVAERKQARATVAAFNREIAAAIDEVEAGGRTVALVDVFTAFDRAATDGIDVDGDGAADLTTRYLGGLFSLDGIHPSRTGHAVIANLFLDAINARFGESIRPADVARIARRDRLAGNRFRPEGEPPFGLIGDDADEVERYFTRIGERIAEDLDDLGRDLRDDLSDFFDDLF